VAERIKNATSDVTTGKFLSRSLRFSSQRRMLEVCVSCLPAILRDVNSLPQSTINAVQEAAIGFQYESNKFI
jgi:hypothetical protein